MDDADQAEGDDKRLGGIGMTAVALNEVYGVSYSLERLDVIDVSSPDEAHRHIAISANDTAGYPFLALSPGKHSLLALSVGSDIRIYDLQALTLLCTLRGVGRSVTALSWSSQRRSHIISGRIDGSIDFWDIRHSSRPYLRLVAPGGPCRSIAIRRDKDQVLATSHSDHVLIWDLAVNPGGPVMIIEDKHTCFISVAWQPGSQAYLAVATSGGELVLYDAFGASSSAPSNNALPSHDSDVSDDYLFGTPDECSKTPQQISKFTPTASLSYIQWLSDRAILAFAENQRLAWIIEFKDDEKSLTHLWSCDLEAASTAVAVQDVHGTPCLVSFNKTSVRPYDLPATTLNSLPSTPRVSRPPTASANQTPNETRILPDPMSSVAGMKIQKHPVAMKPAPIFRQRLDKTGFEKTSRQLQRKRTPSRRKSSVQRVTTNPDLDSSPPQHRSMTSSLELPKSDERNDGSPMPFLSPSIPARKSPQTVISPLEEGSLELPPLPESSFNSIPQPIVTHDEDDDSDDDTFVDGLQSGALFLPGGINVPLPKACGALFAPNGQLLTFFPPKPRIALPQAASVPVNGDQPPISKGQSNQIARLFPKFGNLGGDARYEMEGSDSVSSNGTDEEHDADPLWLDFQLPPSSFPSQPSWQARISPIKPQFSHEEPQPRINISIFELDELSLPATTQQMLAQKYQLLREDDQSGGALCENNARIALSAGQGDVSHIWQLLAMLLEDKVPLKAPSQGDESADIFVVVQEMNPFRSVLWSSPTVQHAGPFGHLRWADSPLGSVWLVRAIFDWAERRADVQHLACFAAVLAENDRRARIKTSTFEDSISRKLSTYSPDYLAYPPAPGPSVRRDLHPIPALHTGTPTKGTSMYESPSKLNRRSNTSSRNPSQPTTPYLEPVGTTPPSAVPALSRQNTRLSISGSASPEAQRSSFSAAAKWYAMSITDKIAASYSTYGTSPPIKRLGSSASPTSQELSTSLPGGSLSKSVSFAASSTTAATARGTLLSRSFDENDYENAYDSDKTVEDSSLPHTPRSPAGEVAIQFKNEDALADEISGAARTRLLPDDIATKARHWIQYYAEQLRAWGCWLKAAELEKVSGFTGEKPLSELAYDHQIVGVVPSSERDTDRMNACVVCMTMVITTEQLCPKCLHASHLSCLAEYSAAIGSDDFTCPAGCGCTCSVLPYVVEEISLAAATPRPSFKKKLSFTDPRQWRARNEGDSW